MNLGSQGICHNVNERLRASAAVLGVLVALTPGLAREMPPAGVVPTEDGSEMQYSKLAIGRPPLPLQRGLDVIGSSEMAASRRKAAEEAPATRGEAQSPHLSPAILGSDTPNVGRLTRTTNAGPRAFGASFPSSINVRDFGAIGNGNVDDTRAIEAALSASKRLYFPAGTYKVTSSLAIPSGATLVGESKSVAILKRFTTSDLISSLGAGAALYDITLDGNGERYTSGRGIVVPTNSGRQTFVNVAVVNCPSACLEFAADGGSEFSSFGSTYYSTGALGLVAAVKVAGTDTQAIPRKFYATESQGCTLFDIGGSDHFYASGFYSNGLIFGAKSKMSAMNNMRVGAAAGAVTIRGGGHILSGVSAVPLRVMAIDSIIDMQAPDWDVTDSGTGNSVTVLSRSHAVTWTGTGSDPSLGNGSIYSRWSRTGNRVMVQIDLQIGDATSLGSGTWEFSLPVRDNPAVPIQVCGVGLAANKTATAMDIGAVRVQPGAQKIRVFFKNGTLGAVSPFSWAGGDTLRLSCDYVTK